MDRFVGVNQTNNESDQTLHHNTFDSNIIVVRDYDGNNSESWNSTGIYISANKSMIRNNIIFGFQKGIEINENPIVGGSQTTWVFNNTVITNQMGGKLASVKQSCTDMTFRNNIFYNSYIGSITSSDRLFSSTNVGYFDPNPDLNEFDSDYNIFIGESWSDESSMTLVGVMYLDDDPTLAEWRSEYKNGINSIYADALVNTTINVENVDDALDSGFASIETSSPAINAGDSETIFTNFDFFGNERSDLTIGAIGK
jgi:hypothetical protein